MLMGPHSNKITVLKNVIIIKFCKIRPKQTLASLVSGRLRLKKLVLSQLPNTNQLVKGEQKKVMSYHGVSFERSAKSGLIMNKGWIRPTWPSLTSPPPLVSSSTSSRQHPPRTGASSPSPLSTFLPTPSSPSSPPSSSPLLSSFPFHQSNDQCPTGRVFQ